MSEYISTYQQWQALRLLIRKSKNLPYPDFQYLKKKERELLVKLNNLL